MEDTNQFQDDEIEIREFIETLWAGKKLISIGTALAAGIALVVAFILPEIYRAEAVLSPAEEQQTMNGIAGQYNGAAALLGVNFGVGSGDKVNNAIAVMNSREFIGTFIEEHGLLVPLFAGTWDKANEESGIDDSKYDSVNDVWLLRKGMPSRLEAYREFSEILTITGPDRITGIVEVSIDWHDPLLASQWVNQFVSDINTVIKRRDVEEAVSAISYLRNQLETTQLVEMQRVFSQLIESQTRITMLADVRDEYVLRVIDPAVVPDRKVAPRRVMILIIGGVLGMLLSVVVVLVRRDDIT